MLRFLLASSLMLAMLVQSNGQTSQNRPRAREAGLTIGIFSPGRLNAITDVAGVRVGHATVIQGERVRTGVTAILPHGGNLFLERVPTGIHVGNGFGKLTGLSQVRELGELETPVLLTNTLSVWQTADALVEWMLARSGMSDVRSINPLIGETNDGFLNDIRARSIRSEHVRQALETATTGAVAEGSIGAGTGTVAFGWKGGIGTSSRRLPASLGGHTVGVLVQTNFGGVLTIGGAPVGRELGRYAFQREVENERRAPSRDERAPQESGDGSVMIVVATDAPLDSRNLERLAARAIAGLARTGAGLSNGSGDYVIAFSTHPEVRRRASDASSRGERVLTNDAMSPLFQAVAEATEEAIYNSLFRATTMRGHRGTIEALPLERTLEILRRYNAIR